MCSLTGRAFSSVFLSRRRSKSATGLSLPARVVVGVLCAPRSGSPVQVGLVRWKASFEPIEEELNGRVGPQLSEIGEGQPFLHLALSGEQESYVPPLTDARESNVDLRMTEIAGCHRMMRQGNYDSWHCSALGFVHSDGKGRFHGEEAAQNNFGWMESVSSVHSGWLGI